MDLVVLRYRCTEIGQKLTKQADGESTPVRHVRLDPDPSDDTYVHGTPIVFAPRRAVRFKVGEVYSLTFAKIDEEDAGEEEASRDDDRPTRRGE